MHNLGKADRAVDIQTEKMNKYLTVNRQSDTFERSLSHRHTDRQS